MLEDVQAGLERSKESPLHVFEVEDEALVYTKSLSVHYRDPRRTDLLHASVSGAAVHFLKKNSDIGQLAEDGRVQHERHGSVLAPGVGRRDDQHSTSAEKERAVPG